MRYSPDYKKNARAKLLAISGAVAKKDGFAATGVDTLMAAAGFTSGAFYSHFRSKADLLQAVVENELTRTVDIFSNKSPAQIMLAIRQYLSLYHVEHPEQGCAVPSLSAEIGRADTPTKELFEHFIVQIKEQLQPALGNEQQAWAVMAQTIGAVVIARAMANNDTRQALLKAVAANVEEMMQPQPKT